MVIKFDKYFTHSCYWTLFFFFFVIYFQLKNNIQKCHSEMEETKRSNKTTQPDRDLL